jgi:F-type H+-transporting ATPase subunit a
MRALALVAIVLVVDIAALFLVPPLPHGATSGECTFPVCFVEGNLEFPAPVSIIGPDVEATGGLTLTFVPSISNSLFTMWIVGGTLLLFALALRIMGFGLIPGRLQNLFEWAYEGLENFAISIAGAGAIRFVPIYAAFFLLILFSNWSGLLPIVGRIEYLRAPTSDINVTIGLALVSFAYFEYQGFRANGVIGYLGRFFPLGEFRKGIAAGVLALFVGLVELLLEFVKPVTLSMRLFGNIYGGEVALGVLTALTIAFIPVALYLLEGILNFIQALIFSVLTLVFTVLAVEAHEEGHEAIEDAEELTERHHHQAAAA